METILDPPSTNDLPLAVTLADGRIVDLRRLSRERLLALQWEQEREFARRILAATAGSLARADVTRRAYDAVTRIYAAAAGLSGKPLRMGLDPRYERLVLAILERQRRRGLPVRFFEIGYAGGILLKRVHEAGFPVAGIEVSGVMQQEAGRLLGPDAGQHLYRGDFLRFELPRNRKRGTGPIWRNGPRPTLGWCPASHKLDLSPFSPQGPFSLIYWNDVLEHIPPDEAAAYLRRINELLLPCGTLVTITPNWHIRPSDVTSVFCPPRTEAAGVHLKEYTLRELTRLLHAAGFGRVATPWCVTPRRIFLCGSGMAGLKRLVEPALEGMPFRLARLLCRGMGLSITVADKSPGKGD